MVHKFKLGQCVIPARPQRRSCGAYIVVKQLPDTSYEPQYWIQGVASGIDCIVRESEIKAAETAEPGIRPQV